MGIGNSSTGSVTMARAMAHYPSWGSGTAKAAWAPLIVEISLPLMGIGNELAVRPTAVCCLLITPHGDREPSPSRRPRGCHRAHYPSWGSGTRLAASETAVRLHSLPLMGIGNGARPDRRKRDSLLITPHGDREPPRRRVTPWARIRSLPLMGIGNLDTGRVVALSALLITPHGDRELLRHNRRSISRAAHYPSWGSGTREILCWLIAAVRLITPHGDRELDESRRRGVVAGSSLPLMGIGN